MTTAATNPPAQSLLRASPNASLAQIAAYFSELRDMAKSMQDERVREMEKIRGIKPMTYKVSPALTGAATILLGGGPGIRPGYAWSVKQISGTLSASDSVAVYRGESATSQPIAYAPAPGATPAQLVFVVNIGSEATILPSGESLYFSTSGTGNILSAWIVGIEAPAEEIGKLAK